MPRMRPLCRPSRCPLFLAVVLLYAASTVFAQRDHTPVTFCSSVRQSLAKEKQDDARDAIQSVQSVDSFIWHTRYGRPQPTSSEIDALPNEQKLLEYIKGNDTALQERLGVAYPGQKLDGSAVRWYASHCLGSRLNQVAYAGRPTVSVLLEYFKRPHTLGPIVTNLKQSCASASVPCELVVNVDNPHEAGEWARVAAQHPGFVVPVFSANVHEARGYNRAAAVARGRYLVIWQDDQLPPTDGSWLLHTMRLFDAVPQLGIIGMNTYRLCRPKEVTNIFGEIAWKGDPRVEGLRWTFAQYVDFAPMAIRAHALREMGGLEEGWSNKGDCGITGDWELCARAMANGWLVGFLAISGLQRDSQPGGTHVSSSVEKCWGRQMHVGSNTLGKRYMGPGALMDEQCERVWLLNALNFELAQGANCLYGNWNTKYGNCTRPSAEAARAAVQQLQLEELLRYRGGSSAGAEVGVKTLQLWK